MFFDSVLNFPIVDGRSGQQTVDMIQKKLETLGAEKTGNFAVDSETYQSQSRTWCILLLCIVHVFAVLFVSPLSIHTAASAVYIGLIFGTQAVFFRLQGCWQFLHLFLK